MAEPVGRMLLDKFPNEGNNVNRSWYKRLKKCIPSSSSHGGNSRNEEVAGSSIRRPENSEQSSRSSSDPPRLSAASPELVHEQSGFQRKEHVQEEKRTHRKVGRDVSVASPCGGDSKAASIAEVVTDRLHAYSAVRTPRVPGDELWRSSKADEDLDGVGETFINKEGLSMKVPTFLTKLTGASREGNRAVPFLRRRDYGFEVKKRFSHASRKSSKFGTLASVSVPISAKQWLLQAVGLKDSEIREMFDQMESNPQLAAEYVREIRNEWEAMEARENRVPLEANFLVKDRALLEKVRELIVKFIRSTEHLVETEKPPSPEQGAASDVAGTVDESMVQEETKDFPMEEVREKEDQSVASCKDTEQMEARNETLPSFIPLEDYVINKYVVKPELLGKSDCKSAYSPCDKRWYTVVFPALQPAKREDAQLLKEWLHHAMQRNCSEKSDGRFENVESAFLLHCIAFLEIVRQVDIHCEERGNLLLHLWRQLLRIFNQVMVRAEPVLNTTEEEMKRLRYDLEVTKGELANLGSEQEFFRTQYEVISKKLKDKELDMLKIKRCRLCCTENMSPRSRDDYLKKLKKRSIGFRFDPTAVAGPPAPPTEEELKKIEEERKKLEEEFRRDELRKQEEEEAADMAKLEGEMDMMEQAAAEARAEETKQEKEAEAAFALKEKLSLQDDSTQTDDMKGLRRCHSAPAAIFPPQKPEEPKEDEKAKEGEEAAGVTPGTEGGEAVSATPGQLSSDDLKDLAGGWVDPQAKENSEERVKEFEQLAVDTISLLDRLPMEGALAEKIETILKKYCELTGTVLAEKSREKFGGKSFMRGSGDGKVSFMDPRASEAGRPNELMNRKSRKSKGSKWGSQLKSYVPLGFAKMMKIYNTPKNVKFFNVRQLTKLISAVYVNKIVADAVDDSCNNERQTCCEFVYDFMLNQYGLKGLSESAIFGVFKTIKTLVTNKEIEKHHKIRLFSRFVGMDDTVIYSEPDLYLYLKILQKASVKLGVLLPSDQDDGLCYLNCSQFSYICDEPNLVSYFGSQAATTSFVEKYVARNAVTERASPEIRKITKESDVRKIDWDLLMEAILSVYPHKMDSIQDERRKSVQVVKAVPKDKATELENLFIAGDANQDGVLTFSEFKEIVMTASSSIAAQSVLRMFRETLLLMPDGGDSISPAAFAQIAYNHDIEAPPSVVFDLLKKTWSQAQSSIDPEKVNANKDDYEFAKEALLDLMHQRVDVNSAVQTFRQFVLAYCSSEEEEEPAEEEEQQEDMDSGKQEEGPE